MVDGYVVAWPWPGRSMLVGLSNCVTETGTADAGAAPVPRATSAISAASGHLRAGVLVAGPGIGFPPSRSRERSLGSDATPPGPHDPAFRCFRDRRTEPAVTAKRGGSARAARPHEDLAVGA